jgi:hypothetical protein
MLNALGPETLREVILGLTGYNLKRIHFAEQSIITLDEVLIHEAKSFIHYSYDVNTRYRIGLIFK